MMKKIKVNYMDLITNYDVLLKYAFKNSDLFSVITYLRKPYSQVPPKCEHDEQLKDLNEYLVRQILGIREWSNGGTNNNHMVMNVYACNKSTLKILQTLDNILMPIQNDLPEDICFYKKDRVWFSSISHEEIAYIYSDVEADISFLINNNIEFSYDIFSEPYHLEKGK